MVTGCYWQTLGEKPMEVKYARMALMDLASKSTDSLVRQAGRCLQQMPAPQKDGIVNFGPWKCNLKEKSFVLTIDADRMFYEMSGRFEKSSEASWKAVVLNETRN